MKIKAVLILILGAAFFLRVFNVDWDDSRHMHPDERMIMMVTEQIRWPASNEWRLFLSPESPLNPHFFAYGSFPMYFLRFIAEGLSLFDRKFITYDYINLVGRVISAVFDTLTVLLIFRLGMKIKNQKTGLIAALFYSLAVFPIQAAHFYAVDATLTFFILLTLYSIVVYERQSGLAGLFKISLAFGLALSTKVSAIMLAAPVVLGIAMNIFAEKKSKHLQIISLILTLSGLTVLTGIVFIICEPYAVIDFPTFWEQIRAQSQMTKDAFTFPYTLQYVGTAPYLYHLKNMIFWGMGFFLGIFSVAGAIFMTVKVIGAIYKHRVMPARREMIILLFFWLYFFSVGSFAIKFMRYFLPLYPLFVIFAAMMILSLRGNKFRVALAIVAGTSLLYAISFLRIYARPHIRVTASEWMIKNIPAGSLILREHWDDGMPLWGGEKFQSEELKMYDTDNELKWQEIEGQLQRADYIVIASNRLYTPLQKLVNCQELPEGRCYTRTAAYYRKLFNGELGFVMAAEFSSFPTIPLLNLPINDQDADESFTVYDHPKIMIFKKVSYN